MSFRKDFQTFLLRGNVVDLAVGVIIGAAFGSIVTAFVQDLVMPIVTPMLPAGEWRKHVTEVGPFKFTLGHFFGEVVDFLIKALVIFVVLVKFVGFLTKKKAPDAPAAPVTKTCPECTETVPVAAKKCKFCTSALAALALLLLPSLARAQPPTPKFEYAKAEQPKPETERSLLARGGLTFLGGNSQATSGTLGAAGAYKAGSDRVAAEANIAYVNTRARFVNDVNGNGLVDPGDIQRQSQITSQLYQARLRYDRFLTLNNALYGSAQALSDKPAGKAIVGGGQVGYSRQLYKSDSLRFVAEAGYDFAYEKSTAVNAEGVSIHSGRVMVAEESKVSEDTGFAVSVELLANLNDEAAPAPGYAGAEPFEDLRVNGKLGMTTRVWENVSFGFNAGVRYDTDPAPLKAPKSIDGMQLPFAPNYFPRAKKLDTLFEASLIVTLL